MDSAVTTDSVGASSNFADTENSKGKVFALQCQDTIQSKPFSKRTAKLVSQFDGKMPDEHGISAVIGIGVMSDSRIVLLDQRNKTLKMFDAKFSFLSQKMLGSMPWGVAVYGDSEIAVTTVDIVRLSTNYDMAEKGNFKVTFRPFGIAYVNMDRLAISGQEDRGGSFFIYTTTGTQLVRIPIHQQNIMSYLSFSSSFNYAPFYVAVDARSSKAYVSTMYKDLVSAVDFNTNKIVFTYKHKQLKHPRGITVDKDSNIYVCGEGSHNIHQVSADGKCIQILLSASDGLYRPMSISFLPDGDNFVLSSGDRNSKVFKME